MMEDLSDIESKNSSASTEPWFCEPCLMGLQEPPHCELCPSRYGAFKRSGTPITRDIASQILLFSDNHSKNIICATLKSLRFILTISLDIGGQWAHLICAMFIPSITFGDVERFTAVSWQEMDHRIFGRKSCVGCSNKMEARTGVVIQCDAGLCKN